MINSLVTRVAACIWMAWMVLDASAGPWAGPNDEILRVDVENLVDAGLINVPVTTWPLSWGDIARAVNDASPDASISPAVARSLDRLRIRTRRATSWGSVERSMGVALADNPRRLRLFEYTPRANAEAYASLSSTGERWSGKLKVTLAASAPDNRSVRLDGSYLGVAFGNVTVNYGLLDKWWGPGWNSSLVLSTNARPIPGLQIMRNFSNPSELPILRWAGPWHATVFAGELESDRGVPDAKFLGARISIRPFDNLEIGLTRTAQWAGEGRDDSLDSLFNLILGRDNVGEGGVTIDNEPGNQLAGYDWRWRFWGGARPMVFYGQLIGEDEAGGLPSRFLGQFGLSMSTSVGRAGHSLRMHLEYSDTTCRFSSSEPLFNCAYESAIYTSGYRYRDRSIGHSTDNDARQLAFGGTLVMSSGQRYSASVRFAQLNRGGGTGTTQNPLTLVPADLTNIEFSHERRLFDGQLTFGIGVDSADSQSGGLDGTDYRAFAEWKQDF